MLRLHLGCGLNVVPGWTNLDGSWSAWLAQRRLLARAAALAGVQIPACPPGVITHDVRRGLPFPAASTEAIYASHLLEHLHFEDGQRLLGECHRVLVPGGVLRVVIPDLASIVSEYNAKRSAERVNERLLMHGRVRPRLRRRLYDALTGFHDHKWLDDSDSLVGRLVAVGFIGPQVRTFRDSAIADIETLEQPGRVCHGEGICVEAHR